MWFFFSSSSFFFFFFFFFFSLLIGWQLSIWIFCKLFFPLLYNPPLLCSWRLALSIVVEVFPWSFFLILVFPKCSLHTHCVLIVFPVHEWCLLFKFLKGDFLLSPFANLSHSLFYLSILFLTFFSNTMLQYIYDTLLIFS